MRKAYKKLRANETSNMNTTDTLSTTSFYGICSKSHKSCVQLREVYLGIDTSFCNEAAQKAFCKF